MPRSLFENSAMDRRTGGEERPSPLGRRDMVVEALRLRYRRRPFRVWPLIAVAVLVAVLALVGVAGILGA